MNALDHTTCSIMIDGKWFAISVRHVREAIRPLSVTKIPLAPPEILGLSNLRGNIIPVIDARMIFGLNPRDTQQAAFFLVIDSNKTQLALIVDRVADVVARTADEFLETPKTHASALNYFVDGAYQSENGLVLKLEIDRLVEQLHLETLKSVSPHSRGSNNFQSGAWKRPSSGF